MTDINEDASAVAVDLELPDNIISEMQRMKYNMLMRGDIDTDKLKFIDSITKTDAAERKIGLGEDAIAATSALAQGIIASIKESPFKVDPIVDGEVLGDLRGISLGPNELETFELVEGELCRTNEEVKYEDLKKDTE